MALVAVVIMISLSPTSLKQVNATHSANLSSTTQPPVAKKDKKDSTHIQAAHKLSKASPAKATVPVAKPLPAAPEKPKTHIQLMAAAGIPSSNASYVDYIVSHESSWNPYAQEPTTGACGLVQELPCGKSGCYLSDEVCQLAWANRYAAARYGSWYGAYLYWTVHHNW